jgi:hypothetical protein
LSSDQSVTEKCPKKGHDGTCMKGGEDDKGGGTLLEKRAGGDKLEGEGEKINDEECTDLDTTWDGVEMFFKGRRVREKGTCRQLPCDGESV